MITWTKRLLLTAGFLALVITNVLTLTHTAFNAALSGLMGAALGVRTVSGVRIMRHVISVTMPKVPSLPTTARTRS